MRHRLRSHLIFVMAAILAFTALGLGVASARRADSACPSDAVVHIPDQDVVTEIAVLPGLEPIGTGRPGSHPMGHCPLDLGMACALGISNR